MRVARAVCTFCANAIWRIVTSDWVRLESRIRLWVNDASPATRREHRRKSFVMSKASDSIFFSSSDLSLNPGRKCFSCRRERRSIRGRMVERISSTCVWMSIHRGGNSETGIETWPSRERRLGRRSSVSSFREEDKGWSLSE